MTLKLLKELRNILMKLGPALLSQLMEMNVTTFFIMPHLQQLRPLAETTK